MLLTNADADELNPPGSVAWPAGASETAVRDVTRAFHRQRVFEILQHIHRHLHEPLDLDALARVAALSVPHLSCVFRGLVGESVYQHIRRLRLERAAFFLITTRDSVKAISLACGFESQEAFTRAFSRAYGRPPHRFRSRPTRTIHLPGPTDLHYRPEGPAADFREVPDRSGALEVRIEDREAVRLACIRHIGPYEKAWRAWVDLLRWAWRRGRLNASSRFFGLNYDDDDMTPPERQRYDAALVVEEEFCGDGAVVALTLDAGRFAVTRAHGTYTELTETWETFIYQWLPRSGLTLRALYGVDNYYPSRDLLDRPLTLATLASRRIPVDMLIPVMAGPGKPLELP